ncbi:MAG: hypothetical protein M0Z31_14915 [Clostridia bacterium]|nr:hypothetical protein [Clostridia bacterium]
MSDKPIMKGGVIINDRLNPVEMVDEELGEYLKCLCGKKICQHKQQVVVIKCRHCKRYLIISHDATGKGLKIEYK